MAVATGVVAVAGELTGRTGVDMAAKRLSSTRFDRLHRLQLAWGQRAATARPVGRPVAAEDLAKCGHRMPAESVSSTPLANSSAFWVRCVESAVVVGERWPSQSWMTRRLTPASSKWVAQEWRKECTHACLLTPAARRACWNARRTLVPVIGTVAVCGSLRAPAPAGKSQTGLR